LPVTVTSLLHEAVNKLLKKSLYFNHIGQFVRTVTEMKIAVQDETVQSPVTHVHK